MASMEGLEATVMHSRIEDYSMDDAEMKLKTMFPNEDIEVGIKRKCIQVGTKPYLVRICSLYPYGKGIHYWKFEVPYSFIHSETDGEVFLYCFDMRGNANQISGRNELPLHAFLVPKEIFGGKRKLKILNTPESLREFSQYVLSSKGVKLASQNTQKTLKQCPKCKHEWDYKGHGFLYQSKLSIQCPNCKYMHPMDEFEPGVQATEQDTNAGRNALQFFNYGSMKIRVLVNRDGKVWYCLIDACRILQIVESHIAKKRLDPTGMIKISKGRCQTTGLADIDFGDPRINEMTFINEGNLNTLINRSDKPEAKEFQHWVNFEVLPSIKKTGSYSVPGAQEQKETSALETRVRMMISLEEVEMKVSAFRIKELEKLLLPAAESAPA